jgi:hypothetical protein
MNAISPETAYTIGQLGIAAVVAALVSAAFNAWNASTNRKHEIEKENLRRRQELLEGIAVEFESIHEVVLKLCVAYLTHRESLDASGIPPGKGWINDALIKETEKLGVALVNCHSIEGRLMLLGLERATGQMQKYRVYISELQSKPGSMGSGPTPAEFQIMADKCWTMRSEFYVLLNNAYTSSTATARFLNSK